MKPPIPTRLQWEFSDELVKTIDEAYSDGVKVINVSKIKYFKFFVKIS
jgi:hypothetical protein